jgi:hypothetical protein
MFYYLLYNSSFSFIVNNLLFSTVLYGSILYILTHAILNNCKIELLEIINNYFWYIFILDIISLAYGVYQALSIQSQSNSETANLDVSFNLLRNQINTISSYFDKKNHISFADSTPVPTPRQPLRIPTSSPIYPVSTPTSTINTLTHKQQLAQPQQSNNQTSSFSTPITALREQALTTSRNTQISQIQEPIITSNNNLFEKNEFNDGVAESVAGSDIGSILDLEDFEKSL